MAVMNSSNVSGVISAYPKCLHVRNSFSNASGVYYTLILSCAMNALLSVLSVVGNSLILLAIKRNPFLHNPSYCILFNLAVSDLCVGLLVQPSFVIFKAYDIKLLPPSVYQKNYFKVYCIFGVIADGLGLMLSIVSAFTLTAVSVEKYLAISLHLRYAQVVTNKRVIKGTIAIWIYSISLIVWLFATEERHLKYITIFLSVFFFVVLTIVIFCNVKIGLVLKRHRERIGTTESISQSQQEASQAHGMKVFKKSVSSMAYVMILYLLCFVPHGATLLVKYTRKDYDINSILGAVNITLPIVFLNSSLNPLLYCWRFRDIRSEVVLLIKSMVRFGS